MKILKITDYLTFFTPDFDKPTEIQYMAGGVAAGFPSPAEDFSELKISLDQTLVKNREATFYARVSGQSMQDAGLDDGDILVIDRSLEPRDGKIAICYLDNAFTVKRIKLEKDCVYLMPENNQYKPIKVTVDNDLIIWGIVTYIIKKAV